MSQPAKAQEPSMEEILASIRRIIADDDSKPAAPAEPAPVTKTVPPKVEPPRAAEPARTEPPRAAASAVAPRPEVKAAPPPPKPAAPAPAAKAAASNSQDDIDAMLASLDGPSEPAPAPAAAPAAPSADVFDLTESMAIPNRSPAFRTIDPQNDLEFNEAAASEPEPAPAPPRAPVREVAREPARAPDPAPEPAAPPLMSQSTMAAVDSAFNSLAHTVFSQNARTLEDLVKEMLRPMLKSWLDDNLPQVVERIVRAEIERVSRGR